MWSRFSELSEPFGLFLLLGMALAWALLTRLADQVGVDRERALGLLVPSAIGALLGARGLYVLTSPERESAAEALAFLRGGLSGYGALLGAAGCGWLWGRSRYRDWARLLDALVAPILVVVAVARLGCYRTGCDYGVALSERAPRWLSRLGTFARGRGNAPAPAWLDQVLSGRIAPDTTTTLPLHPTQLYEAGLALLLAGLLLYARRWQTRRGELFAWGVVGYALVRAGCERLRADADRGRFWTLSVTEWCALLTGLLALAWLSTIRERRQGWRTR